jgi:hypothetical protein
MKSIGVLNEKSVHSLIKHYIEPDTSCHEVRLDSFIVDILREDGVYEIQSRHFYLLRNKLINLLKSYKVTVVYPVVRTKWIVWVNDESGEVMKRRKSPKKGLPCHILSELYGIRDLLQHENLSFAVVSLDAEEYRREVGEKQKKPSGKKVMSRRYRKGQDRLDCVPLKWVDMLNFGGTRAHGLSQLMPELADEFTSLEFGRAGGFPQKTVHKAMKVLSEAGIIRCVGKQGRRLMYRKD